MLFIYGYPISHCYLYASKFCFQDCHVINTVFSKDLDKWIWVDPTHEAYVQDSRGDLLGLSEDREKLVKDVMVIFNPDANWNNRSSTVQEYYLLEYMAKNLYRFSSPLDSRYDFETNEKGKVRAYVELITLDGLNQTPKFKEETSWKSGAIFKSYKINDPQVFWAKPREVN